MLNMLKLKTSPNHSKSLILGSQHSSSSNFTIFEKINSNRLKLPPHNLYILGNVPCFCPGKKIFILTLHTLRQSLDWPLISVLTSPNSSTRCMVAHWKKFHIILYLLWFMRKLLIVQILERWLLAGKNVPYKFLDDIASKLSTLHAVNRQFVCWQKNSQLLKLTIAWTMDPKKGYPRLHIVTHLCQFMGQNSEIWGGPKNLTKIWKNGTFGLKALPDPPSVSHPPQEWYHHVA